MRRHRVWIVGTAFLMGVAFAPASAVAGTSPFTGTWTSVDTDESNQTMTIIGSQQGALALRLYDDAGTVCGGDPVRLAGAGRVDGDVLSAAVTLTCLPGGNVLGRIGFELMYDEGTDTLIDFTGVVWTRQ